MYHFEIGRAGGYAGELASPDPARNDTAIVATCTGPGQMHHSARSRKRNQAARDRVLLWDSGGS